MHLLSCEHPKRFFNKYSGEYVTVPCGKCNACKNRRAFKYVEMLNHEQLNSQYTFFVTLTYSDAFLPTLHFDVLDTDITNMTLDYFRSHKSELENLNLVASNDDFCIPFTDLYFQSEADFDYFRDRYMLGGIPYASKNDIQLFHKRLNKFFYNNVTNKYQNFRYFVVSELGSTTFRPHFHGIYFVNDSEIAGMFAEAVRVSWTKRTGDESTPIGRIDTQFVESTANSYVAQYINKLSSLPSFYEETRLKPFYLKSQYLGISEVDRNELGGNVFESSTHLQEIFDRATPTLCSRRKASDTKFSVQPLCRSVENRLFSKCLSFGKISSSLRVKLYSVVRRFSSRNWKEFVKDLQFYLKYETIHRLKDEFYYFVYNNFKYLIDVASVEYASTVEKARKWFYLSRRVLSQALVFKVSIYAYVHKIEEYWNNKAIYLLKCQYEFQQEYVKEHSSEDLVLNYPDFLLKNDIDIPEYACEHGILDYKVLVKDSAYLADSNKKTHFKNAYLDSLDLKRNCNNLFNILKTFFYAKKCNEIVEILPSSGSK